MQDTIPELPDSILAESVPSRQPVFGWQTTPDPTTEHRLQFVGSGSEYFRIWIVNLFLSIVTLGIYSAWAKVRREQYFHRNTLLDGSGFDYHGNPKAILKGRIIAVGLLAILSVIDKVAPAYHFPALLVAAPLIPWLLIRSFIFRARNTSFRGLHFDFRGTYKDFCKAFLGYILLFIALGWVMSYHIEQAALAQVTIEQPAEESCDEADADDDACEAADEAVAAHDNATNADRFKEDLKLKRQYKSTMAIVGFGFLGILLLMPAVMGTLKRFQFNNLAFGASGFHTRCQLWSFYGVYLRASLPVLAIIAAMLALIGIASLGSGLGKVFLIAMVISIVSVFYLVALLVTPAYLGALIANLLWNNARLKRHHFVSDQTFLGITGITLLNWILILLTVGLYWPWAKVRLAAYRASHTAVVATGSLDHFIAGAAAEKNAVGEEIADVFDFDIAL